MKIVSLLPSATEIICSLGLQKNLVGVSHECDFPPGVELLPKVTTTIIPKGLSSIQIDEKVRQQLQVESALYSLDMAVLERLRPDLIVTQALCDVCAVAADEVNTAACALPGNPAVVNLEPMSLQDVLDTIKSLALTTGTEAYGAEVLMQLNQRIAAVKDRSRKISLVNRPTVGFLEWVEPMFNAGHWTPQLIEMAGGIDSFGLPNKPSTTLPPERLSQANPDVLFIALCGFDIERSKQDLVLLEKIEGWQHLKCVRNNRLYFTDGNAYFSRPGPRLVDGLEILAHCLHPTRHALPSGLQPAINFSSMPADS